MSGQQIKAHKIEKLRSIIGDHTLANLRAIMAAAPPADDLVGYTLERRIPVYKDVYWCEDVRDWRQWTSDTQPEWDALIRTPILTPVEKLKALADRLRPSAYADELETIIAELENNND